MAFDLNPGQSRALVQTLKTPARFQLLYGGSRAGKTALFVSAILDRAMNAAGSRHLIVRKEGSAAKRAIAKDTLPKMWAVKFPGLTLPTFKAHDGGYFELPNGSQIWIGGLNDEKAMERILGNEYATVFVNEASECTYEAFIMLRSRLAQSCKTLSGADLKQRFYVDLNPTVRVHWTYQIWIAGVEPQDKRKIPDHEENYKFSVINPDDNRENLTREYLNDLDALPERQRRRFRDGVYTADHDNALWRRKFISYEDSPPEMIRVVVAIDPAVSSEIGSDETGIIVMGLGVDRRGYVIADESGRFRPEEWARRAISAFHTYDADKIIAEINNGGAMVEATIKAVARGAVIPYKGVHATRGKFLRAEPIAALYEMGKVRHVEPMTQLEDQMCSFIVGEDRDKKGYSDDRVDALVWAGTELFPRIVQKSNRRVRRDTAKARFF